MNLVALCCAHKTVLLASIWCAAASALTLSSLVAKLPRPARTVFCWLPCSVTLGLVSWLVALVIAGRCTACSILRSQQVCQRLEVPTIHTGCVRAVLYTYSSLNQTG